MSTTRKSRIIQILSPGRALVRLPDGSLEIQAVKQSKQGRKVQAYKPGRKSSIYNWRGGLDDLAGFDV